MLTFLKRLSFTLVLSLWLATLMSFAASLHPWAELFSHFKLQYFLSASLVFLLLLLMQQWRWALLALLLVALHIWGLLPWYIATTPEPIADAPRLKLLHANVHSQNPNHHLLRDWVAHRQPDVILLQEVSPAWAEALQDLKKAYPHHRLLPQDDNFGLALLSRLPLRKTRIYDRWQLDLSEKKTAEDGGSLLDYLPNSEGFATMSLATEIQFADRWFALLSLHPIPPITPDFAQIRNQQLQAATAWAKAQKQPVIMVGDFNASLWSPHYLRLQQDAQLRNAQLGHGLHITWPAWLPLLWTPIDHCLHSAEFQVNHFSTAPDLASDHFPLNVELQWRGTAR